jgi:hypothetical protein
VKVAFLFALADQNPDVLSRSTTAHLHVKHHRKRTLLERELDPGRLSERSLHVGTLLQQHRNTAKNKTRSYHTSYQR